MTTLYWPRRKLCAPVRAFDPAFRTTSGGTGRAGLGQVVASDAGVWKASFASIPVLQQPGYDSVILWQAISGLMEGRLGEIAMPVQVRGRRPLPDGVTDADIDADADVLHDDDSSFDDGSGYASTFISAAVSANAGLRATTLVIAKEVCGTLEPGMRFSIGVRLYQIKTVVAQNALSATIRINFPLREVVLAGTPVEFDHPVCLMRLATDQEMDLSLERNRRAFPTINMVEAV